MDERAGGSAVMEDESLSSGEVAAYLDGRLAGEELARVEDHLANNPSARREIIKASRIISSVPRRETKSRRWIPAAAGLAAVAALTLIGILPKSVGREATPVSSERRGLADEADKIDLVSPSDGERVTSNGMSFTWRPIGGATYRLVVSDAAGHTLLQRNTTDTLVTAPELSLKTGTGPYYWSVDALAPDGSSVTSGVREFVVPAR